MSDTSDIIIEVDNNSDGDFSGAEEDDNENNNEQEDYHADDEEQDDDDRNNDQGDDQQCNNENTCTDNLEVNANVTIQKNEASAAPETQNVKFNGKNEKKKWEKNKNVKAADKGGNNSQNGNTNANNKNNNNQFKNKNNTQQNNSQNNNQNNNQTKSSHQQHNNNNNNNNNNHQGNKNNQGNQNNHNNNSNNNHNNNSNNNHNNNSNNNNNNGKNNNQNNNSNNKNNTNNNNNNNNNNKNSNSNNNNNNNNNNNKNNNSNNNNNNNKDKDKDNNNKGINAQDILKTIRGVIHYPRKYEKPWPLDSFVLRLHYRMGVAIFILGFISIKGNWYIRDSIQARSLFDASKPTDHIYENICLSYPYVEEGPLDNRTRRYLLFYRWVYWSFLIFAGLYYLPRALAKYMDNPRLRKLLEELQSQECRYDSNGWDKNCDNIASYLHHHQGTHLGLYFNLMMCHLFALVIDIGTILFFNFILNEQFIFLLYHVWPLNRDPQNFQDPLSSVFPPFANCTLSSTVLIMPGRVERYGLHLTHMELYEKVFLMLWIWLMVMMTLAAFNILVLFIMFLPFTHRLFLRTASSNKNIRKMKNVVLRKFGLGDIYALFVIKNRISEAEFHYLLSKMTKVEEGIEQEKVESNDKVKKIDFDMDQNTNYKRNINSQWIVDEFPPNAPSYLDVAHPTDLTLGDYFPPEYLRQRRAASTPKPPSIQPVVPAFPINGPNIGQPRYGWNSACYDPISGSKSQKGLSSLAV